MSDQGNESKKIAYAILGFLDEEFRKPTTSVDSRESLEVAMQCLETAFQVTIRDTQYKSSKSLREMYRASAAGSGGGGGGTIPNPLPFNIPPSMSNLSNLFSGGQQQQRPNSAPTANSQANIEPIEIQLGANYNRPPPCTAEIKKQADACKDSGNNFMKDGFYNEALNVYTEAIRLDGNNAVYFCNRSATYIKLNDLDKALRDVQIALQLDPHYARAYGRLGVIHSTLGNHLEAYSCYKKAAELDPANDSYENNLRVAVELINGTSSSGQSDGFADATNQFASIFQNPALLNMATQMLQDPAMQNMMRSVMSNLQNNGTGGGAGGGFEQIIQMGQAIASQLGDAYPDVSDMSGRRPGDRNDQDPPPPNNDSYDL